MKVLHLALAAAALLLAGCLYTKHKIELDIKPIRATIDINLKVDKELDDFFDDVEKPTKPGAKKADDKTK